MRGMVLPVMLILGACSDDEPRRAPTTAHTLPLTEGEERGAVDRPGQPSITMRSGPNVPLHLPPGFTVYPGAKVAANTVVESDGRRRTLLVFVSPDPVAKVIAFYRTQAVAAGSALSFNLEGDERASLGGALRNGEAFAIAARRRDGGTRVEFATG